MECCTWTRQYSDWEGSCRHSGGQRQKRDSPGNRLALQEIPRILLLLYLMHVSKDGVPSNLSSLIYKVMNCIRDGYPLQSCFNAQQERFQSLAGALRHFEFTPMEFVVSYGWCNPCCRCQHPFSCGCHISSQRSTSLLFGQSPRANKVRICKCPKGSYPRTPGSSHTNKWCLGGDTVLQRRSWMKRS